MHTFFFEPAGPDTFAATATTTGPWDTAAQHGGPPSALAARASWRRGSQRLASVAIDILRPVPVGKLTARTRTVRPGRRVALVETVPGAAGREVRHARGWKMELAAEPVPPTPGAVPPPIPPAPPDVPGAADRRLRQRPVRPARPASFMFVNVDLNVMLQRDPEGEWLLMDAVTAIGPAGRGVATSTLSDQAGPVGRGAQALLIGRR